VKEVVKSLESKAAQLESKVIQLLESNDVEMKEKVTELEAKVQQQDSLLTSLLREKTERAAENGFDSAQPTAEAINELPSSCEDLKTIGHTLNGFQSVMVE
jgi:predicted nuclease with TOPRIM domain